MQSKRTRLLCAALVSVAALVLQGCGDDAASLSDTLSNLSQLPDADDMVAGNGTYGANLAKLQNPLRLALNLQSVSGTPPKLIALSGDTADQYFWNGLVATINGAAGATSGQRNQFWGQDTTTPGPGGHGACMMAQSVGESLSRMLQAASTACYMKGMVSASSGVTVSGSSQSDAFKQQSSDRIVRVDITNFSGGHRPGSMNAFFKIYGSDNVGGDIYKYDMWMCESGSMGERETMTVNKGTGEMTSSRVSQRSERNRTVYTGSDSISAYLTVNSDGSIGFDRSRSRTATSTHTGGWGNFKGQIEVTGGDLIKAKRYFTSTWGTEQNYSVSAFSGTSFDNFAFLQAAYKGRSVRSSPSHTHTYSGVTEYRDSFYASVASSDLSSEVDAFSITSDDFLSSFSAPSFSADGFSCSDTADVTVTMDFSDSAVQSIGNACESSHDRIDYEMCNTSDIRSAMSYTWAP